jgi:hypothetical protein
VKKKLSQVLVFLVALTVVDFLFYLLKARFGEKTIIYMVDYLIKTILLFLLLEGLLYGSAFTMKSGKVKIFAFVVLPLILSLHIAQRWMTIDKFYFYSKSIPKRASVGLWEFDEKLGHKAIPNASGSYNYYIGDTVKGSVPVMFDEHGYRTVNNPLKLHSDKKDLFLGCSFTFGDFLPAENTYSYLTAKTLQHEYINCGRSAYGLAQMYQIANTLVPKEKFTYVFIQLSPWLADRAMSLHGPTFFGYRPFPFFSKKGDSFEVIPPSYTTTMYKTNSTNWRESKMSYGEKLKFTFTDGMKIEVVDFYAYQVAKLKNNLGLTPKPTTDKKALEAFFYEHLVDLCHKHGATPVVLKLRYDIKNCGELVERLSKKATVIDLDAPLDSIAKQTGLTHDSLFALYHRIGNDSVCFDNHPNKYANMLFAEKICNSLTTKTQ